MRDCVDCPLYPWRYHRRPRYWQDRYNICKWWIINERRGIGHIDCDFCILLSSVQDQMDEIYSKHERFSLASAIYAKDILANPIRKWRLFRVQMTAKFSYFILFPCIMLNDSVFPIWIIPYFRVDLWRLIAECKDQRQYFSFVPMQTLVADDFRLSHLWPAEMGGKTLPGAATDLLDEEADDEWVDDDLSMGQMNESIMI